MKEFAQHGMNDRCGLWSTVPEVFSMPAKKRRKRTPFGQLFVWLIFTAQMGAALSKRDLL